MFKNLNPTDVTCVIALVFSGSLLCLKLLHTCMLCSNYAYVHEKLRPPCIIAAFLFCIKIYRSMKYFMTI